MTARNAPTNSPPAYRPEPKERRNLTPTIRLLLAYLQHVDSKGLKAQNVEGVSVRRSADERDMADAQAAKVALCIGSRHPSERGAEQPLTYREMAYLGMWWSDAAGARARVCDDLDLGEEGADRYVTTRENRIRRRFVACGLLPTACRLCGASTHERDADWRADCGCAE